jgi:hypothetical protein
MALLQKLSPPQARELAMLIELEACWENLRVGPPKTPELAASLKELQHKQKAYEAFRVKLVAYNKAYRPAHVPELLLNTPDRLSAWCQSMVALNLAIQDDQAYPTHLLEKAHRWANQLSDKLKAVRITRPPVARTVAGAILELQNIAQWCTSLSQSKLAG